MMQRIYTLNLRPYGISDYETAELIYFCLQYDEKRKRADSLIGARAQQLTGMPGGGQVGNPTESIAIKREKLMRDVDMIDAAAAAVDNGRWKDALIEACCRNTRLRHIPIRIVPTLYSNAFYKARREFFIRLKQLRDESRDPDDD